MTSALAAACSLAASLAIPTLASEQLEIAAEVVGRTPESLGYNLGHFLEESNAADWFRYSGVDSARLFMQVADVEPEDDLPPAGDGVSDEASFFARRAQMRANAADPDAPLSPAFADWNSFSSNLAKRAGGVNALRYSHVLETLRNANIGVLLNLSASPGRFPLEGADDWAGRWELWQHFYVVGYLLSRDFEVRRFSMFNEPNATSLLEEQWHERLQVCADALQAAVADMSARHGRARVAEIFAPTTANGAEKYRTPGSNMWGSIAVQNRNLRLDGTRDPAWRNLHVYSYQKYTTRQFAEGGFSGFLTDHDQLRGLIAADMAGEPPLPLALTEFNVRTGASYDGIPNTLDSPSDFSSLGASLAGLATRGMERLYLFKFAQTASASFYGVAKNGTHFCQNASGSLRQYGGATRGAEVYRLFLKAARGARPIHRVNASAGASPGLNQGLWNMATQDETQGMAHLFLANRDDRVIPLEIDFSALGIPAGNPYTIEQVSATRLGGVVTVGLLAAGKTATLEMPARSVWLISVPTRGAMVMQSTAVADTSLADGAAAFQPGAALDPLEVRSDGTADGRRVALIRLPLPSSGENGIRRVLLQMDVASDAEGTLAQAHVYGIESNDWSEQSLTWRQADSFLRSGVAAGNRIENNVVTGHGSSARILGQLAADSVEMTSMGIDVTDFAQSRTDGMASFLIVQEHRWDVALPSLESGDTQAAGLRIRSREGAGGAPPRLVALTTTGPPPSIGSPPQSSTVPVGSAVRLAVETSGPGPLSLQWRRNGKPMEGKNTEILEFPSAETADSGDYDVVVSNPFGSVTSEPARLLVYLPGTANVRREATIRGGTFASQDVDEESDGYLLVKHSSDLSFARKSYLQFDLPPGLADMDAPATLVLRFQNTFSQQVRLWTLSGFAGEIAPSMTWSNAPANAPGDNAMLATGSPTASLRVDSTRIAPGSALSPHSFAVPRLGDWVVDDRLTVVLTGVDDPRNHSGGLRLAPGAATLEYQLASPLSSWRAWQEQRFADDADDPLLAGPMADPDLDGLANLIEFALGGDPNTSDVPRLPRLRNMGNEVQIRFLLDPTATSVELACQRSPSPAGPWSDIARAVVGAPLESLVPDVEIQGQDLPDGLREITVRMLPSGQDRGFFRLEARLLAE